MTRVKLFSLVGAVVAVLLLIFLPPWLPTPPDPWDHLDGLEYERARIGPQAITRIFLDANLKEAWAKTVDTLVELDYLPSAETLLRAPDFMSGVVPHYIPGVVVERADGAELGVEIRPGSQGGVEVEISVAQSEFFPLDEISERRVLYDQQFGQSVKGFFAALAAKLGE